ncbi:MMPL family transporter [Lentilactobacillus senioris]|uniref:MMPL family transporter n=1 Tax=Lentilactobacillus senioris TaxID=931534 RepID=UPI0022822148|nr:MMPL family transporter [Lentilactobacillus senioris]MCY9806310.1 MMPL family transporter [Lentilactobacillus senioris]
MKEAIHKLHKNRVFSLLLWLIVVFVAIIQTPNVTNLTESASNISYGAKSQPAKAADIKSRWGYQLNNTTGVTIVYNNPNGAIKADQKTQIDKTIKKLQKNKSYYSIKKVTTIKTNLAGKGQLISQDKSTELVELDVDPQNNTLAILTNQLVNQTKIKGLSSYVTSPEIVRNVQTQKVATINNLITIALFIVAVLIVGVYFRSILAAFVSLITLFSSYVVSLGAITNLTTRLNAPFSVYTPLEIAIATIVMGLIWNIYLFRRIKNTSILQTESVAATRQTIKASRFPITMTGLLLALAFGSLIFIHFTPISSLYAVGISYLILMLAVLTINPIFTAALGESVFWPNVKPEKHHQPGFWNRLVSFSLWQPLAGLLMALYLTFPFIYNFRPNLSYTPLSTLTASDQAVQGAQVLQTHFAEGKATPVTIYLENDKALNKEKYLQQIDALTTKLQSMPGVNSVYSVTQPSGMPISKYYVTNQLGDIQADVKSAISKLTRVSTGIASNRRNINIEQLNKQIGYLKTLTNKSDKINSKSTDIQKQVSDASNKASVNQQRSANSKVKRYEKQLDKLNTQLDTTSTDMDALIAQANNMQNYSQTIYNNMQTYNEALQKVKNDLKSLQLQVKNVQKGLNNVYDYLAALQKSTASNVYYITNSQLEDTDFLQTMYNYTSQNKKITSLQVIFNNAPNSSDTPKQVQLLQDQIKTQLQGTTLKNAQVAVTGEPVYQSLEQHNLQRGFLIMATIMIVAIALAAFILSRAILQPFYWLIALIMSVITGTQLTYLALDYVANVSAFDWQVPILAMVVITAVGAWQIISLGLSMRYTRLNPLDWIRPSMASYGQVLRYILLVVILISLALTYGSSMVMIETAMISGFTFVIYYLILPMIVSSLGKMAVTAPDKTRLFKQHTDDK